MPDFAVSTAFTAQDKVSASLKNMRGNAVKFGDKASSSFKKASKSAISYKKIIGGILGASLIRSGVVQLQQGLRTVTEEFVSFDQSLTSASAKFPEKIGRATAAFDELGATARKVGAETQFSAAEAAKGLEFFAMAGFSAAGAMKALPVVVDLATATNTEFTLSADAASDALGSFGLASEDAAVQQKNLLRIADVFTATVTGANTTLEQLFETMKDSGPVIKATGSNVETFGALLVGMANAGIKSTKAGTTLKNAYLRLAAPPREAAKELDKLNIKTRESNGDMRDIIDILADVEQRLKSKGTAERAAALDAIFSKRAIAGVSAVLDAGTDKLKAYREQMENAGGTSARVAAEMRKSLQNRLLSLKSSIIEVGFKFIDAFEEKLPGAIDRAITAVRKFDVKPVIEAVKNFAGFVKEVFIWTERLAPVILGVVAALVTYRSLMMAVVAIQAIQFFFGLVKAIQAAAAAQGILNAVMMTSPIGAIAVAIGLVIAGIVLLYQNWDLVVEFFDDTVRDLGIIFNDIWTSIKDTFWSVVDSIKAGVMKIWNFWSSLLDNPFIAGVATIFLPFITIPSLIIKNWEPIKAFFVGLWVIVRDAAVGTWKEVKISFFSTIDFITTTFWNFVYSIRDGITSIWNFLMELLDNPFFTTAALIVAPWLSIPLLIIKHWEPIKEFFVDLWEAIKSTFNSAVTFVEQIITKIVSKIKGMIGTLGAVVGKIGSFLGGTEAGKTVEEIVETGRAELDKRKAPNQSAVEGRRQDIGFNGRLDIYGAPKGSVFESETRGAPPMRVDMMGENI